MDMASNVGGNGGKKTRKKERNSCEAKKNSKDAVCVSARKKEISKELESTSGNGSKKKNSSDKIMEDSIIALKRRMHKEIFDRCVDKYFLM